MNTISTLKRSLIWSFIGKWSLRLLGIVSTLILARLLTPDDFGLIATASIITGFFELFARLGTDQYIIQKENLTKDDINTAWSLQFIVKLFVALIIVIFASTVAEFMNESRLENALYVLATIPILVSLTNVGNSLLVKDVNFKPIMKLEILAKIVSFISIVSLAFWLKNYWAFLYGSIINQLFLTLGSYYIHSFRPKFALVQWQDQYKFSKWVFLKGFVNYAKGKVDQILVTKYLGVANTGTYNMAQKINALPTEIVISPLADVLVPSIAKYKSDPQALLKTTETILMSLMLISLPIIITIILFSDLIVLVMLGDNEKWASVGILMQILSPLILTSSFGGILTGVLTIKEKVKLIFFFELITSIFFVICLFFAIQQNDLAFFLKVRVVIGIISFLIMFFICRKEIQLSSSKLSIFLLLLILPAIPVAIITVMLENLFSSNFLINEIIKLFIFWFLYIVLTGAWFMLIQHQSLSVSQVLTTFKEARNKRGG
ncbi:lipopolysaccharide biosynthesis protein [Flavobacterium sp. W21_SRS_FM6]|uniref:lipopolysaccharide biosynthesis protein n=1 Tax=Flavobacterium sp. W21_SRS_FM6 TaxID=3240268 RepID=UPI003F8FEF97